MKPEATEARCHESGDTDYKMGNRVIRVDRSGNTWVARLVVLDGTWQPDGNFQPLDLEDPTCSK